MNYANVPRFMLLEDLLKHGKTNLGVVNTQTKICSWGVGTIYSAVEVTLTSSNLFKAINPLQCVLLKRFKWAYPQTYEDDRPSLARGELPAK